MNDIDKRLGDMSPEKRLLLRKLMQNKGLNLREQSAVAPPSESTMVGVLRGASGDIAAVERTAEHYMDKNLIRDVYNAYHVHLRSAIFHDDSIFMNLGYVSTELPQFARIALAEKMVGRNYIKLVLETIGDGDLKGRRVLDVGCGRGGAIHTFQTLFEPKEVVGIDLTSGAIEFCRARHAAPNAQFLLGDAEKLPFGDASFDVVTNIESSHHYSSIGDFYAGVFRVLAPGGYFFYTTMLPTARFALDREILCGLGFVLERDVDITRNVLAACDQDKRGIFEDLGSANDNPGIANAISLPGSDTYNMMAEGVTQYRVLKLKKPEPGFSVPATSRRPGRAYRP